MVEEEYDEESNPETVRAPANDEAEVVVAIKLPTVSWVPVAIRLPEELVVTMELIGNVLATKLASLLNQESLIEDEAIVLTRPADPV